MRNFFIFFLLFHVVSCNRHETDVLLQKLAELPGDTILRIETYDGSNQVVHPDIMWSAIDTSFYLAITPYPFFKNEYENPVIYKSSDGLSFVNYGQPNPLVARPEIGFNCDPDLFLDEDGNKNIVFVETNKQEQYLVRLTLSSTGEVESKDTLLHQNLKEDDFILSPSISLNRSEKYMAYVELVKDSTIPNKIKLGRFTTFDSIPQINFRDITQILPDNYEAWHIDLISEKDSYYLLVHGFYNGKNEHGSSLTEDYTLHLFSSNDMKQWISLGDVLEPKIVPEKNLKYLYRSTGFVKGDTLSIWYSYVTNYDEWRVGFKKVKLWTQ